MLRLTTLGAVDLRGPDGREFRTVLTQRKRLSLLIYLALEANGRVRSRDTILGLFWPAAEARKARNALSQSLSFLRSHLPKGLLASRGVSEIGLVESALSTDVLDFKQAIAERRWADALETHRGPFLAGFHVRSSAELEDWISRERTGLTSAAAEAAWALAQEQVERDALTEGVRTGSKALTLGGLSEGRVQSFLISLSRADARVQAIQFFERFRNRLHRELDLDPSPELVRLVDVIRREKAAGLDLTRSA